MPFSPSIRRTALLWCDRHCCLCKRPCGLDIEIDHLVPEANGGPNTLDNAIPLCFDCHARTHRYNNLHPRGTKYFVAELRVRRDQVYEEFTRSLVPPVRCEITQDLGGGKQRDLPDVGFRLVHCGDGLPVKVRVTVTVDRLKVGSPYYSGKKVWHLNPRHTILGHFALPGKTQHRRIATITYAIIDCLDREHTLLPVQFVYVPGQNFWYLEP
ncbi:MAG TPA: HNH endonuclease [Candidatus Angelobacter sp.]|nr:HNH endonuclease [Candidatus Angelobacter sp.]